MVIRSVPQPDFFILGTKVCLWDSLVPLSILILLGEVLWVSQLLLCACKGRIVMSSRVDIISDVMDVL